MTITKISKPRFDAFVAYTRLPNTRFIITELSWYSSDGNVVLGFVGQDKTDNDYGYAVLGRDQNGRFRAIDQCASITTFEKAEILLKYSMEHHVSTGQTNFPQEDEPRHRPDIFALTGPREKLHQYFVALLEEEKYSPAMEIIREIWNNYKDPDGNFIQQFQTNGFDARLWELHLFAYLTEEEFYLDRAHNRPDFTALKGDDCIHIEAVTANPSQSGAIFNAESRITNDEELRQHQDHVAIKLAGPLRDKLNKEKPYWKLPHVQGHSLILAIQDFSDPSPVRWSENALLVYLYGSRVTSELNRNGQMQITEHTVEQHRRENKVIPSGFFLQPNSENISAVLFSNCATIPKFNRMGWIAGFGSRRIKMIRKGLYFDQDPNAFEPKYFIYDVTSSDYTETWGEGLVMFHNPQATYPVKLDLFPTINHYFFENGEFNLYSPQFHPFSQITFISVIND